MTEDNSIDYSMAIGAVSAICSSTVSDNLQGVLLYFCL